MSFRRIGVILGAWLAFIGAAHAQDFPNRPIRIVIPYSPGSVADVFARIVAQPMAEQWKGSIVVESKSGANGSIAAEEVARAAPDGYTWLLATTFFVASPALKSAPAVMTDAKTLVQLTCIMWPLPCSWGHVSHKGFVSRLNSPSHFE